MDLKGELASSLQRRCASSLSAPVPTQCMQAVKIRSPRSIEAYTGNLVMKIQVSLLTGCSRRQAEPFAEQARRCDSSGSTL